MKGTWYCLAFTVPISVGLGLVLQGIFTFSTVIFMFVLLPVLDLLFPGKRGEATFDAVKPTADNNFFRILTITYALVQISLIICGAVVVSSYRLNTFELIGIVLSVGVSTGTVGLVVAHELIHKRGNIEQFLGKALLLMALYMHYYIEHLSGHHVHVSTREDPSSAQYGESFYQFFPRTLIGSYRNAWKLEIMRLKRQEHPMWGYQNQMLWFTALPVLMGLSLGIALGWEATLFYIIQGIIGFTILEIVNYVEHYGLEREEQKPEEFEQVSYHHSWDSRARISNFVLFKLQFHADHHVHPHRAYQKLRHHQQTPELPTGYAGMSLLVLIPPLWRKIMHPRIAKLKGDTVH